MVAFVSDSGLANVIAAWLAYTSAPLYVQFGTGSGQSDTDNDLATAVQSRELAIASQETVTVTGDTFRLEATITADQARSISEVGAFDAAVGGNMDVYGDFTAINLADGDAIVFAITVTVS